MLLLLILMDKHSICTPKKHDLKRTFNVWGASIRFLKMKNALTEEIIRDSADISEKEKPITKLSFIRISNQKFIDLSILLKLQNLRIISLTFCSISSFPKEFFKIPTLESIDLKGNNITKLTDENWELLPNLKILNLSDNEISQIAYINSLSKIPMLRQLNLTGNPIMTDSNSFDQVVEQLPKLDVLNDFIILSQHRGLTQKIAFPNNIALLPYTQIDDYYFLFLRYMRNNTIEYNVRQMHVGFFSLNRVIRKYSSAVIIQSVFRGFLKRKKYKKMRNSIIFLKDKIRFWYRKRNRSSLKIQKCFLRYKLKLNLKQIIQAKKIQNVWKLFVSRKKSLLKVFEQENKKYKFLTTKDIMNKIVFLCDKNEIIFPNNYKITKFALIRFGKNLKKRNLIGSPFVYFNVEESILIRKIQNNKITENSIWCSHNHKNFQPKITISPNGINYTKKCPFSTIKPQIINDIQKKTFKKKYNFLLSFEFDDEKIFQKILDLILATKDTEIIIFPNRSVKNAAAQLTIHSSIRMFNVRKKLFSEMKLKALENRSLYCINKFIKSSRIKYLLKHLININKFNESLPNVNYFFMKSENLNKINDIKIIYPIKFGYKSDKTILLSKELSNFWLSNYIPFGNINISYTTISSIFNFGTIKVNLKKEMFTKNISQRELNRSKFIRINFSSTNESRYRAILFVYLTNDFTKIVTENQLYLHFAALRIQNCWNGYKIRKYYLRIAAQLNKKINFSFLINKNNLKRKLINDNNEQYIEYKPSDLPPKETIAKIRNEFQWNPPKLIYKPKANRSFPNYEQKIQIQSSVQSRRPFGIVEPENEIEVQNTNLKNDENIYEKFIANNKTKNKKLIIPNVSKQNNLNTKKVQIIPEKKVSNNKKLINSQKTDRSLEEALKNAISKLIRLRQIENEIHENENVNNEIEIKRKSIEKTQNKLMTTKRKRETERQNELQQIIQRNKIEKKEITENITHKREKSQMKKLKNAKNIKKTFRKFQENREFANKFICASRKIAQISQEKHQKQENAKAFAKLKEHTQELRNESENIKKSYKEKTEIIKMINQKNANEAKVLNEEKRKVQTDAFERRIQRTREIIEMEKEFMMSLKERLDTQKFVPREKTPVFETDMVGGASAFIGDYIGMSLGTVESRLISEIISEII